jgi:hypothetical protein
MGASCCSLLATFACHIAIASVDVLCVSFKLSVQRTRVRAIVLRVRSFVFKQLTAQKMSRRDQASSAAQHFFFSLRLFVRTSCRVPSAHDRSCAQV